MDQPAKDFYTVSEAADLFQVSERTIQRWITGDPSHFPNARRMNPNASRSPFIIPPEDIEAELKRQQAQPPPQAPADPDA